MVYLSGDALEKLAETFSGALQALDDNVCDNNNNLIDQWYVCDSDFEDASVEEGGG